MDKLVINGGKTLNGELAVGGSKNAVLPILAALLLAEEPVILKNVPNLTDVMSMIAILREMGAEVEYNNGELYCNASHADGEVIPTKYVREIRSSVIFLGSAIARNLRAWITYPGGCEIGQRPINIHIEALKQLGIDIVYDGEGLQCTSSGLKGADIYLSFPSVGATENVMLAAARAKGKTVIRNAAREPEI
ncbi:MAG: UDP-N-acetylglucosamine 1-carboxyvinyltransferase, partial [Clostridiales bacterium]|nr:UDP-N-acetylglucosamine 1-carboxyvinyltransferase [Clostridiales bacterium]